MNQSGIDVSTASAEKFRAYLHDHGTDNEDTLLKTPYNLVVKTSKPNSKNTQSFNNAITKTMENMFEQAEQAADRDFVEDRLARVQNCLFVKGFVPNQTKETRALSLTDPKPDLTWGKAIPKKQEKGKGISVVDQEVKRMIKVCPGVQYAFLIAQFKSAEKSIEKAENQSILTGAAMVEACHRIITTWTDKVQSSYVDSSTGPNKQAATCASTSASTRAELKSIAFTISWIPQLAKLYLHWCEERGAELPIYHATNLNAYLFCKQRTLKENLVELRNDVMNIFEWEIYTRMNAMTTVLREIYPNY
ncbi:MAG: hypothetical protein Q9210_006826 [Variospora velana]